MSTSILHRRGSNSQVNIYTGPAGEIVINTDKKTIHVQDGSTPGGITIAKYSDIPTKVSELVNDANFTQFAGATATVDANIGTPSVTVTESGSGNNKGLIFSFKNLKGAKGDKGDAGTAYIMQTWSNGTSWYRKYSDGWIEQGGFYYKGSAVDNPLQTVTLPTPFSTRTYVVSTMPLGTGTSFSAVLGCDCYTASYRTTSKFTIHMNGGYFGYEWYATGK